jgi:hypothetical protein
MSVLLYQEYYELNEYLNGRDSSIKTAELSPGGIADLVSAFVTQHIDPNDKTKSLINFIGPGMISALFTYMEMPKIGYLIAMATSVLHIDFTNLIGSLSSALKPLATDGGETTTSSIRDVISRVMDKFMPTQKSAYYEPVSDSIRLMKMAELGSFADGGLLTDRTAAHYLLFTGVKKILTNLFGWIFPILFASCGFIALGDGINALLKRPSAFTRTLRQETGSPTSSDNPGPVAKQKSVGTSNLKPNSYYSEENHSSSDTWAENYPVNKSSIENMLLDFADDVYDGLKPFEPFIRNSRAFQRVVGSIVSYNNVGDHMTFIPRGFKSKKQIVDLFLRDLSIYLDENPQLKTASATKQLFSNNGDK